MNDSNHQYSPRDQAKNSTPLDGLLSSVLVVEDEAETAEEISELLSDAGFSCDEALDSRTALKIIRQHPEISIVVTDLQMPGLKGLELIKELNETLPPDRDLAVIVATGQGGMDEAIKALRLGAMDFLTKPISPDHLVHAVRRADETLKLRRLERHFQEQLKSEVDERTAEVRKLASDLEETNASLMVRNRELAVADRVKDDFLTLISHELRTPLNAVIGFSEIMVDLSEKDGNDTAKEYSRIIATAGRKLLRIVNTILELVNVECGNLKLDKTSIDVADLIGRVVEVIKPKADERSITLTVALCQPLPMIHADANRVIQALGNVVENAIHFSPPGSEVRIDADATDDTVMITVTDCGKGMTAEEIQIAGQTFRQVDASAAKEVYGLGLGLPLARLFVELHGGELKIDSTIGGGTVVTISIPHGAIVK